MTRVGFIGLGAIGRPMARHAVRKLGAVVWNRTVERSRAFAAETGAAVAPSAVELVRGADVVMTCLPTSREVREVVDSTAEAWRDGQLLIDLTSGDPATSREIAAELARRGVGFVDAPVSGGTAGAEAGRLTVMLGGEPRWAGHARQLVAAFATTIVHVGPVGTGHALKAINNALLAVGIQAAGEGLAALVKLGVPASKALEVINASSGRSNVTENLFPQRVVSRAWPRTFRLALLDKDLGIAVDVLRETGVPSEAIVMAKRVFAEGRKELGEDADHVELVKVIERRAGVEIR
ncbi:MAG TPA: NAD(P)-dependent oxidoreductase [Gemmatimonadales bacterium]|nr:NAD(P)-dependent oxidoreductase [Gemmatimonadales bacterium]